MIATKVIPLLVTFLVNKSGTKAEFERYHECVTKFITRIKDKRLQDLQNNPFKAKAEEPEDTPIQVATLEGLLNQTKSDGFDSLFSKQNQLGGQSQQQKTMEFGLPNPGTDNGGFDFGEFNSFPSTTISGGGALAGASSNGGSSGLATPTTQFSAGGAGGFSLPKPPEKSGTPQFKPPTIPGQGVSSSTGNGGLSLMDLGFGTPQPASGMGGFKSPQPAKQSNYSAFDEFTLNDDTSTNVLGLGGMTGGGSNGGMGLGGLGLGSSGMSGGMGGNGLGMATLGTGGMGNTLGGGFGGLGGSNSGGFGNMGSTGLGMMGSTDPFSKGNMGGLMLGANNDPFDFSNLQKNTSTGMNTGFGMGTGMGSGNNLLGSHNSSMGSSNMLGSQGFGGNMNAGLSSLGGLDLLGSSNTIGSYSANNPGNNLSSSGSGPKTGGLFSNPNLVIKGSNGSGQNTKPTSGNSNLNDFNLL
jgi:hypothetical protein